MTTAITLAHEFVTYVPETLEAATVYISIPFATTVHQCCCGCENQVVTPLSPTDWSLTYDGESVSLNPSIGNWSFACQSHYWIVRSRVQWAPRWSQHAIVSGRAKAAQYGELGAAVANGGRTLPARIVGELLRRLSRI